MHSTRRPTSGGGERASRDRIAGYLDAGKAGGAKAVVGGGRPKQLDKGWFIEPTVFTNVDNSMKIARRRSSVRCSR